MLCIAHGRCGASSLPWAATVQFNPLWETGKEKAIPGSGSPARPATSLRIAHAPEWLSRKVKVKMRVRVKVKVACTRSLNPPGPFHSHFCFPSKKKCHSASENPPARSSFEIMSPSFPRSDKVDGVKVNGKGKAESGALGGSRSHFHSHSHFHSEREMPSQGHDPPARPASRLWIHYTPGMAKSERV